LDWTVDFSSVRVRNEQMSDKATCCRKRCLNPGRDKRIFLQNVQTGPWGYLASYSVGTRVLRGYSSLGDEAGHSSY